MAGITADDALNASFSWALWKVLDFLSTRYLPGSLFDDPQAAASSGGAGGPARLSPQGNGDAGTAASATEDPIQHAIAALATVDPVELQSAFATLSDDDSPLVRSLAWAIGAPGLDAETRQYRLEASLMTLSRAEAFALLALVLYAARGQA